MTLTCNISNSGTPITDVYWTYSKTSVGGQATVTMVGRHSGSDVNNPSLVISDLVMTDAGYYRCVGVNEDGESPSKPVQVLVTDSEYCKSYHSC